MVKGVLRWWLEDWTPHAPGHGEAPEQRGVPWAGRAGPGRQGLSYHPSQGPGKPGGSPSHQTPPWGWGRDKARPGRNPISGGQVQAWCREPGSDTAPRWPGRALGMETGRGQARMSACRSGQAVAELETSFPWRRWGRDRSGVLSHGYGGGEAPGALGRDSEGPC